MVRGIIYKLTIIQVACGWQHTLCLSQEGRVYSWGYGEEGQLGHDDTEDCLSPKEITFFREHDIRVAFIAAGHSHSGAITSEADTQTPQLYTWGNNSDHRLMIEDRETRLTPSLTILEQVK